MSGQGAVEKTKLPAARRGGHRNRAAHRGEADAAAPTPEPWPADRQEQMAEGEFLMSQEPVQQADADAPAEQNEPFLIRPTGAVEISRAAELKQQFQAACASGRRIVLCLQDVTEMDATAVQLLWALRQAAGERLQGQGDLSAEAAAALAEADLGRFLVA
jgi:hypothetical protein